MESQRRNVLIVLVLFFASGDCAKDEEAPPPPKCGVISHYGLITKEVGPEVYGQRTVNGYEMTIRHSPTEKLLAINKVDPELKKVIVLVVEDVCKTDFLFDNITPEFDKSSGNTILTYFRSDGSKKRITISARGIVLRTTYPGGKVKISS